MDNSTFAYFINVKFISTNLKEDNFRHLSQIWNGGFFDNISYGIAFQPHFGIVVAFKNNYWTLFLFV